MLHPVADEKPRIRASSRPDAAPRLPIGFNWATARMKRYFASGLGDLAALPPTANTCILREGASTAKGKTHVANDAGSVRGDCIVGSGRSLANRRFRTRIQSGERWNHGGRQCRVCRSRRTAQQNVGSRPGRGTIQVEQSGAGRSPAGQFKSIPAPSHRQPCFASRSSFPPEQLRIENAPENPGRSLQHPVELITQPASGSRWSDRRRCRSGSSGAFSPRGSRAGGRRAGDRSRAWRPSPTTCADRIIGQPEFLSTEAARTAQWRV